MAEPIVERIAQVIVTRIQEVTQSNDYHQTVNEVIRVSGEQDINPDNLKVIVNQLSAEEDEQLDYPGDVLAQTFVQAYEIAAFVLPSVHDKMPLDQRINRFVSDIRKAIGTPAATWHTFGDLAINARMRATQQFQPIDGAFMGASFDLEVTYRHPENDPYTVRL